MCRAILLSQWWSAPVALHINKQRIKRNMWKARIKSIPHKCLKHSLTLVDLQAWKYSKCERFIECMHGQTQTGMLKTDVARTGTSAARSLCGQLNFGFGMLLAYAIRKHRGPPWFAIIAGPSFRHDLYCTLWFMLSSRAYAHEGILMRSATTGETKQAGRSVARCWSAMSRLVIIFFSEGLDVIWCNPRSSCFRNSSNAYWISNSWCAERNDCSIWAALFPFYSVDTTAVRR